MKKKKKKSCVIVTNWVYCLFWVSCPKYLPGGNGVDPIVNCVRHVVPSLSKQCCATDSVYANCGSSEVLARLLEAVDAEKVTSVQFLRGGRVRLTFKDQASCDDLISPGLVFDDVHVRVVRADLRYRSVYVRDLPFEVPDDDIKAFFESYGDVLSVRRSTFANREFKQISTDGATTAAVTEKVWGEYVSVVCILVPIALFVSLSRRGLGT